MRRIKRIRTYSLPVRIGHLDKNICLKEAEELISSRHIMHMTRKQIAAELYAHAVVYYCCMFLEKFHLPVRIIKLHANPIDLSDYGDTQFRQFCFNLIWLWPGRHFTEDQEN